MKFRPSLWWLVAALLIISMLGACTDATPDAPTPPVTSAPSLTETPAATATPQATATTAPTPTPTPPVPQVQAVQQRIGETRTVVISVVTVPEPGWLVVYAGGDEKETVVGYAPIPEGSSQDVAIEVDPFAVTPTLTVRLHSDTGEEGLYEFPEADPPLEWDGAPVEASFPITLDLLLPALTVADQAIDKEGQVEIAGATVPRAGWIALHADVGGEPGPILGQTPLPAGRHQDIVITFDWRRATTPMHVRLYEDLGVAGRFEPESVDIPFTHGDEAVGATFDTTLPLDIYVIDQPVEVTGEVVIDRVTVDQPAWVAVYTDFSGYTDRLLGFAAVEAGVTEMLTVPVETAGITSVLHVQLHADKGTEGQFEYPGRDEPIQEGDRLTYFSFQTDAGSYVVTVDQPVAEEVEVPLVVADMPVWLVIQGEEEDAPIEEPGPVLGTLWLSPGIHRDLTVPIEGGAAGTTMLAALYLDDGEPETFEYPDGPDVPLRHLRAYIRAPFTLTE